MFSFPLPVALPTRPPVLNFSPETLPSSLICAFCTSQSEISNVTPDELILPIRPPVYASPFDVPLIKDFVPVFPETLTFRIL